MTDFLALSIKAYGEINRGVSPIGTRILLTSHFLGTLKNKQ